MKKHLGQLRTLGFVRSMHTPEWISSPIVVPKKHPADFGLDIDYLPVNPAAVPVFWPMSYIDAELLDVKYAVPFASLDFCSGY